MSEMSQSATFPGVYFELADANGHRYGPLSDQVKTSMRDFDHQIAYILNELDRRDLNEEVNVMLFSDHGMAAVSPSRTINLTQVLLQDVHWYMESGPILFLWPQSGKVDIVSCMSNTV